MQESRVSSSCSDPERQVFGQTESPSGLAEVSWRHSGMNAAQGSAPLHVNAAHSLSVWRLQSETLIRRLLVALQHDESTLWSF